MPTKIEWAHETFNPWWGCVEISPACDACYARTWAERWGHQVWGKDAPRRFFGDKHWAEPLRWQRRASRTGETIRVFCGSQCDIFEYRPDLLPHRLRLFQLIEQTPDLTWMLLTKRPQKMRVLAPDRWRERWPKNVWAMTTVESQKFTWRIDALARVPAVVRGISAEPLLGPLDLKHWLWPECSRCLDSLDGICKQCAAHGRCVEESKISWIIGGGESGFKARPMHPNWARSLRDQCASAEIPFLFKQWGEWGLDKSRDIDSRRLMHRLGKKKSGRLLDGREHNEFPKTKSQEAACRLTGT